MISPGLGSIDKVAVHLIVAEGDTHCSPYHARRIQREIGSGVKSFDIVKGFTHGTFGKATGKDYVDVVLKALAAEYNSASGYDTMLLLLASFKLFS